MLICGLIMYLDCFHGVFFFPAFRAERTGFPIFLSIVISSRDFGISDNRTSSFGLSQQPRGLIAVLVAGKGVISRSRS